MSFRNLTIGVVVLLSAAVSASGKEPATKPAFTLAKDTTYITKPLLPDGRPDYVEAINEEYGKGVTPENNAAVPLVEALGPDFLPKKTSAIILKRLGMKAPEKGKWFGEYFKPLPDDPDLEDDHFEALEGPWRTKDFPKLAEWLKSNAAPLDKVVAASKRPRYFMPIVATEEDFRAISAVIPSLVKVRVVARALVNRSNLALAKGRTEDAWADVQAVHRLAALLEQDSFLIGQLVGIAVRRFAEDATVLLVTSGKVSLEELQQILKDIPPCGSPKSVSSTVEKAERFVNLDILTEFARNTGSIVGLFQLFEKLYPSQDKEASRKTTAWAKKVAEVCESGVDWDSILRRCNAFYDTLVKAMRAPYGKREKAFQDIAAELRRMISEGELRPWEKDASFLEKGRQGLDARTKWVSSSLVGMLAANLAKAQMLGDSVGVKHDLTVLSIGLAIYHAEKGEYPVRLGMLAPKYLKTVPKDFFSGNAFVYKRKGAGYVLYSVGENAKDDGGMGSDSDGDDLVVETDK